MLRYLPLRPGWILPAWRFRLWFSKCHFPSISLSTFLWFPEHVPSQIKQIKSQFNNVQTIKTTNSFSRQIHERISAVTTIRLKHVKAELLPDQYTRTNLYLNFLALKKFIRWRLVLYFPDTEFHTFFSGQVPISSDILVVRTFPDMSSAQPSCRS